MNMRKLLTMALVAISTLGLSVSTWADGLDNYDSGTGNLIGSSNGQITYLDTASGGTALGTATFTSIADASAQSAPNVAEYKDNSTPASSLNVRLEPGSAIDMAAEGSLVQIEFDWKTVAGPGSRVSMVWLPQWSTDANASFEDFVGNGHKAGISDGGWWFLNSASPASASFVQVPGDPRYEANNWYRTVFTVSNPIDGLQTRDYTLELIDIDGGNVSLGSVSFSGASDVGTRTWLTGLGLISSGNPGETTLFDNFSFTTPIPEPSTTILLGLASVVFGLIRRRQVA